jgi:hypothetical protein
MIRRLQYSVVRFLAVGAIAGGALAAAGPASAHRICPPGTVWVAGDNTCEPMDPPPPPPASGPGAGSGTQSGSDGTGNEFGWNERQAASQFVTNEVHTNPIAGHSAWWMDTTATLDTTTGILSFSSHIEDDNWFGGYTGGVTIFGTDQKGDILAVTPQSTVLQAGVCGEWEFCGNYQNATGQVLMTGDYHDVTDLVIVNWHDVHNRLTDDLNQLGSVLQAAGTVATSVVTIVNAF